MHYLKIASISALLLLASGCSSAQSNTVKGHSEKADHFHSETGMKKLSAPIQITHDFSGAANLGVMEDVKLSVKSLVPGSKVSLEVLSGPAVQVFETAGFDGLQRPVDSVDGETMSLQFQPLENGIHDIIVRANVYLPDGQFMTSTYSVPVVVGKEFQATKKSQTNVDQSSKPQQVGGLAIMEAEETIKD